MTTDFLLEEILRFAYAATLMGAWKLVTAVAVLASILGGACAARALGGRRASHRVRRVDVRVDSRLEVRDLVQRATRGIDVTSLLSHPGSSRSSNEVAKSETAA